MAAGNDNTDAAWLDPLREIVGPEGVCADPDELYVYHCDGFPIAKGLPQAVVFPRDPSEAVGCVRILAQAQVPIIPRGSGTGLTGGCVAFGKGVIINTSRMTKIEFIDLDNRLACVQAGVRNLALSEAVAQACAEARLPGLLHFAPDPSSQRASTIGGNVATNAGGLTTLKHGVTTQHIAAVEWVLPDATVATSGLPGLGDAPGADVRSLLVGSEGVLGLVTRVWCRLTPKPQNFRTLYAVFNSTADACKTVSDIIAAGITPAAMEMMDGAMVRVVEEAFAYGFPADAQALLLIEIDGIDAVLDEELQHILAVCARYQARGIQHCADAARRAELWSARKRAFGAIGRISRSYCTQDACIPRSQLPTVMETVHAIGARHGLRITSVFHAGDGNIHPIFLFDEDKPEDVQRVLHASEEVLSYCVSIGGTITGEHGVGVEKLHLMPRMFTPDTLAHFGAIKDALDGGRLFNDGKLLPSDTIRIELHRPVAANVPGGAL